MSAISKRIVKEMADPEFRKAYKRSRVRTKIVYQIRALRKQRDWLQGKLAELMGKPQSTVSRFEDVDYGKLTLETLFEISDAFDLGLIVEFVAYPEFMIRTSDLSEHRLVAPSYNEASMAFLVANKAPEMITTQTSNFNITVGVPSLPEALSTITYHGGHLMYNLSTLPSPTAVVVQ